MYLFSFPSYTTQTFKPWKFVLCMTKYWIHASVDLSATGLCHRKILHASQVPIPKSITLKVCMVHDAVLYKYVYWSEHNGNVSPRDYWMVSSGMRHFTYREIFHWLAEICPKTMCERRKSGTHTMHLLISYHIMWVLGLCCCDKLGSGKFYFIKGDRFLVW